MYLTKKASFPNNNLNLLGLNYALSCTGCHGNCALAEAGIIQVNIS